MSIESVLAHAKTADPFATLSEAQKDDADFRAALTVAIHNKRLEMGMTQAEFAKYFNVSQTVISRWESGDNNPTAKKMTEVLSKLGLRLEIVEKAPAPVEEVVVTGLLYSVGNTNNVKWNTGRTKGDSRFIKAKSYALAAY